MDFWKPPDINILGPAQTLKQWILFWLVKVPFKSEGFFNHWLHQVFFCMPWKISINQNNTRQVRSLYDFKIFWASFCFAFWNILSHILFNVSYSLAVAVFRGNRSTTWATEKTTSYYFAGCLIGIHMMVYHNPLITGSIIPYLIKQPCFSIFIAHLTRAPPP